MRICHEETEQAPWEKVPARVKEWEGNRAEEAGAWEEPASEWAEAVCARNVAKQLHTSREFRAIR